MAAYICPWKQPLSIISSPSTPKKKKQRLLEESSPRLDLYRSLVVAHGGHCPLCHFSSIPDLSTVKVKVTVVRGDITFKSGKKELRLQSSWPQVLDDLENCCRLISDTPELEVSAKLDVYVGISTENGCFEAKGQLRLDVGGKHWCPTYSPREQQFPPSGPNDNFQPIMVLGRPGRSGAVWLCYNLQKQKFVACKIGLHDQHDISDEWKAFEQIRKSASPSDLKYLLIPKHYQSLNGHEWVVMPLRGENMESVWLSGRMDYFQWKRVLLASVRGLKALHSTKTLHDDIKFANIISSTPDLQMESFLANWKNVHYPGTIGSIMTTPPPFFSPTNENGGVSNKDTKYRLAAYIVDLDGARCLKKDQEQIKSACSHFFRSPEGILRNPLSLSSDIWSLGATAFLLLTGTKIPDFDDNSMQLKFWIEILGLPDDEVLRDQILRVTGNCDFSEESGNLDKTISTILHDKMAADAVTKLLRMMLSWTHKNRPSAELCFKMVSELL